MTYPTPKLVRRVSPTQTDISWNNGHFSSYPSWYLREKCPCAKCVEEHTGVRRIEPGSIPSTIERSSLAPVGNYALHFAWSDGHATGIYTWDYLRRICPCPECLPEGLKKPPANVFPRGAFEA